VKVEVKPAAPPPPQQNQNLDREQKKELQKYQRQFQKLEQDISALQQKKTTLELALANPDSYKDMNQFTQLEKDYAANQQQIKAAEAQYETLFEKIMELENM